jgi:glycosyltransferase involved in cell wall biosynthesis
MSSSQNLIARAGAQKMEQMRIAFVVQRYGLEVNGGSETLCRMIAERMARYYDIEVLSTRAVDYVTWKDEYPSGLSEVNGVHVRRFGVDYPRDQKQFDRATGRVFGGHHAFEDEVEWMKQQGPYSSALLQHIAASHKQYDAFVFFTYLYATTYFGLPLAKDRAALVSTCHDEPPIYLEIFDHLFRQIPYLIFLTPEERAFARRRFYHCELKGEVVGAGVEPVGDLPADSAWEEIERRLGGSEFILYVGRIDESKGCKVLIEYFTRYVEETRQPNLKLILVGKTAMVVPAHPQIIQTGFVSETTKLHAIRRCRFMVAPSPYESLCISALESWLMKRPVLANGNCAVLRGQCKRSNGGLWYCDYEDFRETASMLLSNAPLADTLGFQGYGFVQEHCTWPGIEYQYRKILSAIASPRKCSLVADA